MEHRHLEFKPIACASGPKGRKDFDRYVSRSAEALLPPHKCGGSHLGPDTNPLNPPPWTMRTAANGPGPSEMDASSGRGPLAWVT